MKLAFYFSNNYLIYFVNKTEEALKEIAGLSNDTRYGTYSVLVSKN